MAVKTVSRDSSNRENWDKVFKSLVKILRTKQDQLETLVKERKIIESSMKTMKENWVSDVRNYEDQLSLMVKEIETMKMMQLVETSKSNLLSGLKERDRFISNLKLQHTLDEINDFKAWLASEKKCEVSDLLRQNGFVWNQFKCIETGFTEKLKRKDDEIAKANTKISSLISYQEQLQSSNHDKDETISRLKAKVAEIEKKSCKKDKEISKLSQDVEALNKSHSLEPVLTGCKTHGNGNTVGYRISSKKEMSAGSTPNQQGSKSSKRKRVNKTPVSVSEIPKLFTSTFRVPKLKSPSSGAKLKFPS